MLESWRWFGPGDPVSLGHARQAGARGIVTALHQIYDGRAWSVDDVAERQRLLAAAGFPWSVCESIPTHASIKLRGGPWRHHVDAWKDSLASLGRAGVPVVCYNFMPVVDWTRWKKPTASPPELNASPACRCSRVGVLQMRQSLGIRESGEPIHGINIVGLPGFNAWGAPFCLIFVGPQWR